MVSATLGRVAVDFARVDGFLVVDFFAVDFFLVVVVLRAGARPRAVDARVFERDPEALFFVVATVLATLVDFCDTTHAFRALSARSRA